MFILGKLTQTAKPKQTSTKTKTEEPNADGDWDNDADISTPVVKESVAPLAQSTPVSEHNKGKERSSNSMMSSRQSIPVAELPVNKDVAVSVFGSCFVKREAYCISVMTKF